MLSDARAEAADFDRRAEPAELPEWLDQPRPYDELQAYLRSLEQVNRWSLGARPTLHWLDPVTQLHSARELTIVDVGCGSGDMLRHIERWAERRKLAVKLIGIDLSQTTIELARSWTAKNSRIEWIAGDAFAYTEPVDIVLSALLTHHLSTEEIVRFLRWMEATAHCGWLINDLCRERTPYKLFSILAAVARWHPMVRHDGPASFRRSFREADWERLLAEAGIEAAECTLERWRPGRLCAGRVKSA